MTDIDECAVSRMVSERFSSSENSVDENSVARTGELMKNVRNLIRLTYEYPFYSTNPKKKKKKGRGDTVKRPDPSCIRVLHTYHFV